MAKPHSASSTTRLYTTQEPTWVVWSGFLMPLVYAAVIALVIWRYSPSVWAYACLSVIVILYGIKNKYKLFSKTTLFLQCKSNQWYVVDHLGEQYEVHLLHSWRSPWCLYLSFVSPNKGMVYSSKTSLLIAKIKTYLNLNPSSFSLSVWRQQLTDLHWRDLNLALNRCNTYADRETTKEFS